MDSMIGNRIREYEIIDLLGEGGMGRVYLAKHTILGSRFAIKVLHKYMSNDPNLSERFIREAKAQHELQHKNIVPLSNFMIEGTEQFIVMDYVEGCSLNDLIKRRTKIPEAEALSLFRGILNGLLYAHNKSVVHRDLKPANILVTNDRTPKITDFGLAKILSGADITKSMSQMGTPAYMSPEQIQDSKYVDYRTDIYSLGIILYEMLCGRVPFEGSSEYVIWNKHIEEQPRELHKIDAAISSELSALVLKALAKKPEERYQNCAAFQDALDVYQHQKEDREKPHQKDPLSGDLSTVPGTQVRHTTFTHQKTEDISGLFDSLESPPEICGSYVRSDLEGDLYYLNQTPGFYAKRVKLDVAWHILRLDDLVFYLKGMVSHVEQHFDENYALICYAPGLKPCDLPGLKALIGDGTAVSWKVAKIALDLAKSLKHLHETGFSQAILHPERVAVHNNQFVIMPCVAGVLEPFSKLFSSQKAGWLYYCAPELLRTRAANAELLPQADIFSLGKLFYVLSLPHRKHPYINDPYHFAECLVEQSTTGTLPVDEKIDAESLLTALAVSMCAEAPEERPTLSEIIDRLEIISESVSLESKISRYKNDGKHETALQFIKSLKDDPHTRFFSLPQTTLLLLKADCAVSKASPDFPLAIDQLDKAAAIDPQNFDIQIKIAEVYQKYTDHPQWKQLSAEAYGQAARLSNYRDDIVSSWLDALFLLDKPEKLLLDTASIPPEQRSPGVIARRAACFVKIEKYISAWNESIEYFKKFEPTSEMYELARKAAKNIDSLDLIRWKHQKYDGVKGLEPIVAIVWERNDNLEKARTCFDKNSLT